MAKDILTVEDMKTALLENDRILCHAIVELYHQQEADEKASQATRHDNGRGFSGFDAEILSSFAEQVITRKEQERAGTLPTGYGLLSPKQLAITRKRVPRYAGQLLRLAAARKAARAQEEPAQPAPASQPAPSAPSYPVNKEGRRYFCCDCGQPADVMAWETTLCNGCMGARERADILANRARNDQAMTRQEHAAWQERVEQAQAARLDSASCDCGQHASETWNGLPVCPDCQNTMATKEQGRRYREERRLLQEQAETAAATGERPSLLVTEGDTLRFMTPQEQYAAGYRLDLKTGRRFEPAPLQPSPSDPFEEIPAAFLAGQGQKEKASQPAA